MRRGAFVGICSVALGARVQARLNGIAQATEPTPFNRVKLVDPNGGAIRADDLAMSQAYVFAYPYRGTPSFLIRLDRQAAGGVGPDGTIVAFTAICAHELAYPSREVSAIAYAPGCSQVAERSGVIVCCAHHSVYDPAQGARVLSGPAPEPLAAVVLEYDAGGDRLYATGMRGSERFEDFFRTYELELIDAFGRGEARALAAGTSAAIPLDQYTRDPLYC